MNNKGQLTVEYILLLGIILIIIISSLNMILSESEKNTILTSAQIGASTGINKNGYAMYYNDTFNDYQKNYPLLLTPTEIKIIKIELYETDNKTLELQVTAQTSSSLTNNEKNRMGSRINYYIRKSICETFGKKAVNIYYDPAMSNNYVIKTRTVVWK